MKHKIITIKQYLKNKLTFCYITQLLGYNEIFETLETQEVSLLFNYSTSRCFFVIRINEW